MQKFARSIAKNNNGDSGARAADGEPMSGRHLVHPELRKYLDDNPTITMDAARRDFLRRNRKVSLTHTEDVVCSERMARCSNAPDQVRVLVYRPRNFIPPGPAVLHIHGGGYVVGKPEEFDLYNQALARKLGCIVVSVDYRLAPESPYPCALDDCHVALAWLHESHAELGVDTMKIVVKGESAGGGLAACLAIRTRDEGRHRIALQMLTAPMLDDRTRAAAHAHAGEFIWTAASNEYGWQCYLGERHVPERSPGHAAAARETNLQGLPPTFIAVGALDLFLDEDLAYARRLASAGVPLELHVYHGAYHSFHRAGETSLNSSYEADMQAALEHVFRGSADRTTRNTRLSTLSIHESPDEH